MLAVMLDKPLLIVPSDRVYLRRFAYGLAAAWGLAFLSILSVSDWCSAKNLWSIGVLGLGLWPMARWFYRANAGLFPVFELHALFYGFCFGASSLLIPGKQSIVSDDVRVLGLQATFVGVAVMLCSHDFFRPFFLKRTRPLKIRTRVPHESFLNSAWAIAFFEVLYTSAHVDLGVFSTFVDQPLVTLAWMSKAFIFVDLLTTKKPLLRTWMAFIFLMLLSLAGAVASGSLSPIFYFFIFLMFIFLNIKKKVFLKSIVALFFLLVMLNPIKREFREETWGGKGLRMNAVEKADLFLNLFLSKYGGEGGAEDISPSRNGFVSRLDHTFTLAYVMQLTPAVVPYSNGTTYAPLFTVWIPRVLWPNKPTQTLGNEWAHWYGLLGAEDSTTSYNLPWIVEFYINFGWTGILVGMALCGIIFSWVAAFFCSYELSALEYSVGIAIIFDMWFAESNFTLMFGAFVIGSLSLVIYLKLSPYITFRF